ncbi:MerR family transcriptional regulator [Cohnella lupini]|uniref:MerR-like DNA binding protein n=1 Tax=Cohnella lupini TaxID=1294267 RepID=A0A3D9HNT4_9BACL|nr:MerR family transcriptional regulator [Cohnella lupini]RED51138.1 MerR-like DNA binding protein [Cohnella lupini]
MDGLLRKKDLVDVVGVAKSTIADWVTEFAVYIPTVKHGAVTYYKPEALDVLNYIRELREQEQSKVQIMQLLAKKGFPITVEEAVEDVQRVLSGADPRDTLLTVMQTMGQAVVEIGKQTERQNRIETRISEQNDRMDGQDGRIQTVEGKQDEAAGRMTDLEQKIEEMRQQLVNAQAEAAAAKQEAAEAKEQANKRRGLFGWFK